MRCYFFSRPSIAAFTLAILPLFPACSPVEKIAPAPTDPVSKKIEAFTGGHAKLAWARYIGGSSDVFGNFDKLELWGIDTRDGLGIRPILSDTSNYARPLILPDGSGIVYSNKQTSRKPSGNRGFKPVIYHVDWKGEKLTELGPGYAVDVWRDPKTEIDWVYCTDLISTDRSSIEGSKLERFPLSDPKKRELIWDKTRVSTENIQLSHHGNRASCLFPWPHAGALDLETMTQQKYQHGCWPSMAPDGSHHLWVFDGAHKNLNLFTDKAAETWVVPVNTAPGMNGHESYHPRWSNHVRHFTITGPYSGATVTRSDSTEVEVYIGKFSADLREVEDWLQVTDDKSGDLFPDLWIEGGELASVESTAGAPAPIGSTPETKSTWPVGEGPFLFVWENRDASNTLGPPENRECSVEAKERARFGPHYEMLTDGGTFILDGQSRNFLGRQLPEREAKPFTFEVLATSSGVEENTGALFSRSNFRLIQAQDQWVFSARIGEELIYRSLGPVEKSQPTHLAVAFDGENYIAYRNGKPFESADISQQRLTELMPSFFSEKESSGLLMIDPFDSKSIGHFWSGSLQGVAISASASSPETITASYAHWQKVLAAREPIPTVRLRGKLVEMTESRPVEALDTYQRGLLGYRYEVEEVLGGNYDGQSVIVMHWTILDRTPLSGFPREIGKSYELTLQPYAAHPELSSERQWNDLFDPSELYFDIATPGE